MVVSKGMRKLQFRQELVSTVKNPIQTKDLLARLQELYSELSSASADTLDVNTCDFIKDKFVDRKLLKNSNQGVQAYTACCIADILRLYAPDAPYNASQLTEIFKFFFSQLKHLNDDAYAQLYTQLLQKLAESKSVVLITDLPASDKLVEQLFTTFYDLAANGLRQELEPLMSSILSEVIAETDEIPMRVLKLIMNKFLANASANTKNLTQLASVATVSTPGFAFSLAICQLNVDRLSRQITKFVSDVVYDAMKGKENEYDESEDEDDEENSKSSSSSRDQLKKIHTLLAELWKYVPDILTSVMGLIDNEMEADDEDIRVLATETVGKMIRTHPENASIQSETLTNWRRKALDVSPIVRSAWVLSAVDVIKVRAELSQEITDGLTKSLLDNDERVRLVSSKGISSIQPDTFIKFVANQTLMTTLGQLIREKHPEIRDEIIKVLGSLYAYTFDDLYQGDENLDTLFGWIPESILNLVYINDKSVNLAVDSCFFEDILPFENNADVRVKRLLTVLSHINSRARDSFFAIIKRQKQVSDAIQQLLKFADAEEGEDKIEKTISWLSVAFPDSSSVTSCLKQFLQLKNRRFNRLLSMITSPDSDYATMRNSAKELLTKLGDSKSVRLDGFNSITSQKMAKIFKSLIHRAGFIYSNRSNVTELTKISTGSNSELRGYAQEFLKQLSSIMPAVIQVHLNELSRFISQFSSKEIGDWSKRDNLAATLKIMFNATKGSKSNVLSECVDNLREICENGTPMEAKYAVKILAQIKPVSELEFTLDTIWPLDTEEKTFPTHLSTISEVFLAYPECVEERASELTNLLIKEVLLKNSVIGDKDDKDDSSWVTDEELEAGDHPCLYAKLMSLKLFVNRLRSLAGDEKKSNVIAEPVFKMLFTFVNNVGEIVSQKSPTWPTPLTYQVRLRLAAGLGLLKLAKIPVYNKMIKPQTLSALAYLVEDTNGNVTKAFLLKLRQYLNANAIPEKFLTLVFFTAYEPNEAVKKETSTWVRATMARRVTRNDTVFERAFVRLLYTIAHHSEFLDLIELAETPSDEQENHMLKGYALALEYIVYYLELVATPENISLLYYLATRIKQYRDGLVAQEDYDTVPLSVHAKAIYMLSDLSQLIVREFALQRSIILQTWPGTYQLPSDLFVPMQSPEEARAIASTSFLTDNIVKKLSATIKSKTSQHQKKRTADSEKKKTQQEPKKTSHEPKKKPLVETPSAGNILATSSPSKVTPAKSAKRKVEKSNLTPKPKKQAIKPTRRSSRVTKKVNYAGSDDDDADDPMSE